jgi:hypothetical protein
MNPAAFWTEQERTMADERPDEKNEQTNEPFDEPIQENSPKPNPVAGQKSAEEIVKDMEEEERFQATDN